MRSSGPAGGLPTSIRDGIAPFVVAGAALEIRILKTAKKTVSGYFTDRDLAVTALEQAARQYNGSAVFYVTLNPINRECVARAANQLKPLPGWPPSRPFGALNPTWGSCGRAGPTGRPATDARRPDPRTPRWTPSCRRRRCTAGHC
jgi:hypothetical protein